MPKRSRYFKVFDQSMLLESGWLGLLEQTLGDGVYRDHVDMSEMLSLGAAVVRRRNALHGLVLRSFSFALKRELVPKPSQRRSIFDPFEQPCYRLSAVEVDFFAEIMGGVSDPRVRARLADIVFVHRRDVRYALAAIDAYAVIPLRFKAWMPWFVSWDRAIALCQHVGEDAAGDRLRAIESSMVDYFVSATECKGMDCWHVARLLRWYGLAVVWSQ